MGGIFWRRVRDIFGFRVFGFSFIFGEGRGEWIS